jgi:nicotinic acid phosphoribosyltransferase
MKKQLDIELKRAHANCIYLELMQIELPASYEDSIVLTQVEVQNSKMKKFEQDAAIIRQQISILQSQTDQEIKYIQATAEADSYLLRQTATVKKICWMLFNFL